MLSIEGLAVGATRSASFIIPLNKKGNTVKIKKAQVDRAQDVAESNEGNNIKE